MRAAVLYAPGDLRMTELQKPRVAGEDVLVQTQAVGICPTDVALYQGIIPSRKPIVIGHEFSGIVTEVGRKVQGFIVGDRVISTTGSWSCGRCSMCKVGLRDMCERPHQLGWSVNGAFAEYFKISSRVLLKIPEGISIDEGQSIGIVGCGIRAIRKAQVSLGSKVAIIGPGHAGLILLQLARLAGAESIVVIGTRIHRLKLAEELGADLTVNVETEAPLEKLGEGGYGSGFDIVIDTAGTPSAIKHALEIVRFGGTVLIFSVHRRPVDELRLDGIVYKEIRIL
ncbi:zinc-binding dehydrogenase, partial [Chloroflexota bacterium]